MNLLLIAHSGAFFVLQVLKQEKYKYIFQSLLFSLVFILYISISNLEASIWLFYYYEIILIFLMLLNQSTKHILFISGTFALGSILVIDYLPDFITKELLFISFLFVLVLLFISHLKKEKSIRYFVLFYFLPTIILEYTLMNDFLFYMIMTLKSIVILYLMSEMIKGYHKSLESKDKRLKKLENKFDHEVMMEAKRRTISLERINENALKKAKTDKLTSTLNKEGILGKIDQFIYDKRIRTFSILFFDIDDFKSINDDFGHNVGDKALKSLSFNVHSMKRSEDFFGRYGGDEFIILLKNATTAQALMIAERYQNHIGDNSSPKFTVSMGVATFPNDGKTVKELLKVADDGLYKTKEKGKNGVSYTGVNRVY